MEIFTKEIKGAKYKVYYEFNKQYSYPVNYHVRVIKASYSKLKNFDFRNVLTIWDLKNIIEQELHKPLV